MATVDYKKMTEKEFKEIRIALTNNPVERLYRTYVKRTNALYEFLASPEYKEFLMSNTIEEAKEKADRLDEVYNKILVESFDCFPEEDEEVNYNDSLYPNFIDDFDHIAPFVKNLTIAQKLSREIENKNSTPDWKDFTGWDEVVEIQNILSDERLAKQNETK